MAYKIVPGSFKLFPNKHKKVKSQPDYLGKMHDDDGVEYEICGWDVKGSKGIFIGGKVTPMSVVKQKRAAYKNKSNRGDLDELPFGT